MKKNILITGANGMLAKQLSAVLEKYFSVRFLTRSKTKKNDFLWDINKQYIETEALVGVHSIIHLAGASIADKRWTTKRKQEISSSRIASSQLILDELIKHNIKIDTFISASATGYYGTKTVETIFDENSPKGNDFLSDVCQNWENVALNFKTKKIAQRVVITRFGVILDKNEGALQKIIQPIKFGVGAAVGTGKQYMPWIHIDDLVRIISFILNETTINGIYNAVAPQHITNEALTKAIVTQLQKPLYLPNVPAFVMKLFFGEMATILLEGTRVSSEKIKKNGFNFKFDTIEKALEDLI